MSQPRPTPTSPPRPTELAQLILRQCIIAGDQVIDATSGNGHDTVFLAECVGAAGRVLAFDVQEKALTAARTNVERAGMLDRVDFYHMSHARISAYAPVGSISAVMFNLGYLPGENHQETTMTDVTLTALAAAVDVLKPGGHLSIICYPGHPEGAIEAAEVTAWLSSLGQQAWRICRYEMLATRRPAPFLLLARKPLR